MHVHVFTTGSTGSIIITSVSERVKLAVVIESLTLLALAFSVGGMLLAFHALSLCKHLVAYRITRDDAPEPNEGADGTLSSEQRYANLR